MVSVVIPAHEEEAGIEGCLEALLADCRPGELDGVVVCNGCTDATAELARRFEPRVRVVESDVASKRHALNLGDEMALGFPRCYLDGDVRLSTTSLRRLISALDGRTLVSVPRIVVELNGRPRIVRAFFRVWTRLPYFLEGMASSGVYVLSEQARSRFGEFPDLIADDHFVLSLFDSGERRRVADSVSVVRAPWSAADIVRVKTRAFLAQRQLEGRQLAGDPGLDVRQHGSRSSWLRVVVRDPRLWSAAPVYVALNLVAEVRARRRFRSGDFSWERDRSAREHAAT